MNKGLLRGLPRGLKLSAAGVAKFGPAARGLVFNENSEVVSTRPHDYFDLVIAVGPKGLLACPTPDIYVHTPDTIDVEGRLWLPEILNSLDFTLVVVNKKVSKSLEALQLRPKNSMIETDTSGAAMLNEVLEAFFAPGQVSQVDGGDLVEGDGHRQNSSDFFHKVNKYGVHLNARTKGRKLLMEGA